ACTVAAACCANRQQLASTRRVHQIVHARARQTCRYGKICRRNVIASARPCTPVPPQNLHGKEGVDGSSPSEGSAKAPHVGAFSFRTTCPLTQRSVGMEQYVDLPS